MWEEVYFVTIVGAVGFLVREAVLWEKRFYMTDGVDSLESPVWVGRGSIMLGKVGKVAYERASAMVHQNTSEKWMTD